VRLLSAVALTLLLPALTACSGLPGAAPDGPAPLFHTHISDDGSKRFTFEAAPLDVLPTRLQEGDDNRLSRIAEAAISSSARPPGRSAGNATKAPARPIAIPSPTRQAGRS